MELQQLYDDYYIQIIVGLVLTFSLLGFLLYLTVKSYLLNKALEFHDAPKPNSVDEFIKANCDECQHEPTNIKVGITHYSTEEGARARCEALYKRHKINADITFYFANQPPVKCKALDIWDFNK